MDLPNLFNKFSASAEVERHFLAIEITAETVKSAVWRVIAGETDVVSLGLSSDWEGQTDEQLLEAVDASITHALGDVSQEPNEVIFGLPEIWVDTDEISDTYKSTLKFLCKRLALKPVGFVVSSEAIVNHLKQQEGGPVSCFLVHINTQQIAVSYVSLGVIQGTQVVGRSNEITSDVEEGVARFKVEKSFPSRIVLYTENDDVETIRQQLINFDWQQKFSFKHIPKIDTLDPLDTIKAVALAGGREVAMALGLMPALPGTNSSQDEPTTLVTNEVSASNAQTSGRNQVVEADDSVETPSTDAQQFGFTTLSQTAETESDEKVDSQDLPIFGDDSEVEEVDDIDRRATMANNMPEEPELVEPDEDIFQQVTADDEEETEEMQPTISFFARIRNRLASFKKKQKQSNPTINDNTPKAKKRFKLSVSPLLIAGFILLLAAVGGGVWAYWNLPTAEVEVYLQLQPLEKQTSFTLDPDLSTIEASTASIPVSLETVEVSGTEDTEATGSKIIGDRASGTVTLFNRTQAAKTFDQGTELTADGLVFTLSDSVTIASASARENADFSLTIEPSTVEVQTQAAAIGAQYNIGADTQFSVANFGTDSYVARASQAFSGGSSREVEAVSQDDIDRARSVLIDRLTQEIEQQVTQQSMGESGVITSDEEEILDESASADVGDTERNVSVTVTMAKDVYVYQNEDIARLGEMIFADQVPANYILRPDTARATVLSSEVLEDGTITVTATVRLNLFPQLDHEEIKRNIRGKFQPIATAYLENLPNYVRADIMVSPQLPARISTLPQKQENISIKLKSIE